MADNTTPRLTLDSEPETATAVQEAPTLTLDGADAPAAETEKSAAEPVVVDDSMLTEDEKLLEEALAMGEPEPRAELIAPLDCLMWDRRLIEALFGFAYKWEIYTPVAQRKYGYYVLPLLYGDTFTGRAEIVRDRKRAKLCVNNIRHEEGHLPSDDERAALNECVERFARFNDCTEIEWREDAVKA